MKQKVEGSKLSSYPDDGENDSVLSTDVYLEDDDDDDELCSLTATDDSSSATTSSLRSTSLTATTTTRRVSFAPEGTTVSYDNRLYCREEARRSWYNIGDYRQFKQETSTIVDELSYEGQCSQFSFTRLVVKCYKNILLSSQQQELPLSSPSQDQEESQSFRQESIALKQWYRGDDFAMLGLERNACILVKRAAFKALLQQYSAVSEYQDEDETLRDQCETLSEPSRTFARLLAQAQWEATPLKERLQSDATATTTTATTITTQTDQQQELPLFGSAM